MILRKAFKFRLKPNKKHALLFPEFAGAARWVFNRGLAARNKAWEESSARLSLYDQNMELAKLKKLEETAWLRGIHSQVLQQSLRDLDLAFQHFFRRVKSGEQPGYPRFKCKGESDSFRYPQGFKVDDHRVYLPKIGWVPFRKSREIQRVLKQITVIREGSHWYVSMMCEWEEVDSQSQPIRSVIGIDLGLEHFAIVGSAEGVEKTENPRFLRKELDHLRYLSRQLSKKQKWSQNWKKAKAKLQVFHARIRAKRNDFLHKLSTQLVKSHDLVVVESLKVKSLLQRSSKALVRSISDAGWRQFLEQLKYKCVHAHKKLVEAGDWFPSTRLCSNCQKKNDIALNERIYHCECGLCIHRDDNSAINLRAVGMTVLKACGAALNGGSCEAGILRL